MAPPTYVSPPAGAGNLPTNHAYALAFGLCAGALVLGVVVGLAIPSRGRQVVRAGRAAPAPARS